MQIKRITLKNYRIHRDNEFKFNLGLNIINQPNEWGKSTIIEALQNGLSLKISEIRKKRSWDSEYNPVIRITWEDDGKEYNLEINTQEGKKGRVSIQSSDGLEGREEKARKVIKEIFGENADFVVRNLLTISQREMENIELRPDVIEEMIGVKGIRSIIYAIDENIGKEGDILLKRGRRYRYLRDKELPDKERILEQREREFREYSLALKEREKLEPEVGKMEEKRREMDKDRDTIQAVLKLKRLKEKRERLEKISKEIEALSQKRERLEKETEGFQKDVEDREERLKGIIGELSRLQKELGAEEILLKERENLKRQIREAEGIKQDIERIESKLGRYTSLPLRELENILDNWTTAEGIIRGMGKLTLNMEILKDGHTIKVNDKPVSRSLIQDYDREVKIEVDDFLRLRVLAGEKTIVNYIEDLKTYKKEYHSLEELKSLLNLRRELEEKREKLKEYPIKELKDEYEALNKKIREIEAIKDEIEAKEKEREGYEKSLYESRGKLEARKNELIQVKTEIKEKSYRLKEYQEGDIEEKLRQAQRSLESLPYGSVSRFESLSLSELEENSEKLNKEKEDLERKLERKRSRLDILRGKTERVPSSEELESIRREVKKDKRIVSEVEDYKERLLMLRQLMEETKDHLQKEIVEKAKEKASEYFKEITHKRYQGIEWERMEELKDGSVVDKENKRPFYDLSIGAREQFFFSVRLALMGIIAQRIRFLILDEPFAYFDSERAKATMGILKTLADKGWQIILLTCRGG